MAAAWLAVTRRGGLSAAARTSVVFQSAPLVLRHLSGIQASTQVAPAPLARAMVAPKQAKAKKVRDPERPPRPMAPWMRFLSDFRKQNPEFKSIQVMEPASAKWKVMPATQKVPYKSPYELELQQYRAAWDAYVSSGKKDAWERDPEKPKRPTPPFFRFAVDFQKTNASLKAAEATKLAGVAWKAFSPLQKAAYENPYATEKARFDLAMEQYKASGKDDAWKKKVGLSGYTASKPKAPEKPKRPLSAYQRFAKDFREGNADMARVEVTKKAKAAWTDLRTEKKAPYEEASTAAKSQYEKAMKRYNKQTGNVGVATSASSKRKALEKPKRPLSAYQRFAKNFREANTDMARVEVTKKAKVAWTDLSTDKKTPYEEESAADKSQYEKAMKRYNKRTDNVGVATSASSKRKALEKAKRPLSAYQRFAKNFREANADMARVEVATKARSAWSALSVAKKAPYEQASAADKSQYEKKMKRYNKKTGKTEAKTTSAK